MKSDQAVNGTPFASEATLPQVNLIRTLGDLRSSIEENPVPSGNMLNSTIVLVCRMLEREPEAITIDEMHDCRARFRSFLLASKYAENSIRSYMNYLRILSKLCLERGWASTWAAPKEWLPILSSARRHKCTDVAEAMARLKHRPHDVTVDDVDAWVHSRNAEGRTYRHTVKKKSAFLRLLVESGITGRLPKSVLREPRYGVPLEHLPEPLQSEVKSLLAWKTAEFEPDRPNKAKSRQVSAEKLRAVICRLFGFASTVLKKSSAESVDTLVTKEILAAYATWCINTRGVKGSTICKNFEVLCALMRRHPTYSNKDWVWFVALTRNIPLEPKSASHHRKATKYVDYELLRGVGGKLRKRRISSPKLSDRARAELAMSELIITWLTTVPWRQRNLRECRIAGPNPNLFRGRISPYTPMDLPQWVREELKTNPDSEFWQFHFAPEETKTKVEIQAILPKILVPLLEEYLGMHRPILVGIHNPLTLLVNENGEPMSGGSLTELVGQLTLTYAGTRVTPHLFRDILAFAWLKANPSDYLTLSKMLWHATPKEAIETYGSRFNVSSGVVAWESWQEQGFRSQTL